MSRCGSTRLVRNQALDHERKPRVLLPSETTFSIADTAEQAGLQMNPAIRMAEITGVRSAVSV